MDEANDRVLVTGVSGYLNTPTDFGGNLSYTGNAYGEYFLAEYDATNIASVNWIVDGGSTSGSSSNSVGFGVAVYNGTIFTTGEFENYIDFGSASLIVSSGTEEDGFIAKYDGSGNIVWVSQVSGVHRESVEDIAIDNNGDAYIAGLFQTNNVDFGSSITLPRNTADFSKEVFTARYDGNTGNCQWAKKSGGMHNPLFIGLQTARIDVNEDGVSYTASTFSYSCDFGSLGVQTAPGTHEMYVVSYEPNGSDRWVVHTGANAQAFGHDYHPEGGLAILEDEDGYVYLGGYFRGAVSFGNTTLTPTSVDGFIARLEDNNSHALFKLDEAGDISDGKFPPTKDTAHELSVFPNPTNGDLSIAFNSEAKVNLRVLNMMGQIVHEMQFSGKTNIDLSAYNSGIYFIEVIEGSAVYTKKVILQR